jgi:hypothetical protein
LALVGLGALGLAAVQVLPAVELSRLSIRTGGLGYRQAVAFSLKPLPRLLRFTFLPRLWERGRDLGVLFGGEYYTEYLAYVGCISFVFAFLACVVWVRQCVRVWRLRVRGRVWSSVEKWLHESRVVLPLIALGSTGLLLALGLYNPLYWLLYKTVPGFGLFRVPARWLFLYAFSAAMLAGLGLQHLQDWLSPSIAQHPEQRAESQSQSLHNIMPRFPQSTRILPALFATLGLVEIVVAARHLPLNHPTAPESFSSLRTAPAHIRAAQAQQLPPGRFLSMSDTLFDPGDLSEIDQIYRDQLTSQTLYNHTVSVKRQEILAPNLPLAWRIYGIDGYDGGVLPLARYVHLLQLLLDEADILTDGRIREGLTSIPSSRVLSILGAEYVLTDKVHDVWIDNVFYDLAFETVLTSDEDPMGQAQNAVQAAFSTGLPHHTGTTLGIVSHLRDAQDVRQGAPVARVLMTMRNNGELKQHTFVLRAGQDSAEGLYAQAAHNQARIGREWQTESDTDVQTGYDYVTELSWETPLDVTQVEIEALPFGGELCIRGLALIDRRDQSSTPLLLTARGRFKQVHSGDVKIYQALDALPRAYVVHQARSLADDARAIPIMAAPSFDPSRTVLLHKDPGHDQLPESALPDTPPTGSHASVLSYKPHEIVLQAEMKQPGYVVLSDTWYPGWQASLDGQPTHIERANLAFRAIYVPPGSHSLRLVYRPTSYAWGSGASLGTLLVVALGSILGTKEAIQQRPDNRGGAAVSKLDAQPTLGYNAHMTQDREVEK